MYNRLVTRIAKYKVPTKTMPKNLRIYFDSNVLLGAGWPSVSAQLHELLSLAHALNVGLSLPRAVELELEQHWTRGLEDAHARLCEAEANFLAWNDKVCPDDAVQGTYTGYDMSDTFSGYDAVVRRFKSEWGMSSPCYDNLSVEKLFEMAIGRTPPFKEQGAGFQDAVILLSIIQDLVNSPDISGILISDDKIFSSVPTKQFIDQCGAELRAFRTTDEVVRDLKTRLDELVKHEWDQDQSEAIAGLVKDLAPTQDFLTKQLHAQRETLGRFFGGSVTSVSAVDVSPPSAVHTPLPSDEASPQVIGIGFVIDAMVHARVATQGLPEWYRQAAPTEFRKRLFDRFNTADRVATIKIDLQADATRAGGHYGSFKLKSARPADDYLLALDAGFAN
jgi:hypothetical protein